MKDTLASGSETFTLEACVRRSFNYYGRLVDAEGLPYFNVFWTSPPGAAHDWPDFGDVLSRQFQACIMARRMTGQQVETETCWREKILSYIDPGTGLLTRPLTGFSKPEADWGDAALTLYALATALADAPDDRLRHVTDRMVSGVLSLPVPGGWGGGFMIKSLMTAGRVLGRADAVERAGEIARQLLSPGGYFPQEDRLPRGAHMHGTLRTLVGMVDWALAVADAGTLDRVVGLYEFVRSMTTRFGFLCEVYGRQGDVIACETCAIMDLLGLATTLANHGHAQYWDDVERFARNHLVESQIDDASWLGCCAQPPPDTNQFTWRDIAGRVRGAFSGWSSPNHVLACRENLHWGGPELRGKPRALQNCCGGSGVHGFFITWKNAARFQNGVLRVNLHIDKLLPQAEVRSCQPHRGQLDVLLKAACRVEVRVPGFASVRSIKALALTPQGPRPLSVTVRDGYLDLGEHPAGAALRVQYPLPVREEEAVVGNEGYRQYRYAVTWKGDTVVRMEPMGNECLTGASDFENRQVEVYYGKKGPGPLYQRGHLLEGAEPVPTPIHEDAGFLDFWACLQSS